jgi:hypothetical protein
MVLMIRVIIMDNGGFVDLSHFGAELMLAKTLFDYGARTPVVSALCGIKRKTATRIYRLAQHQAPIKGMLPWDPHWISRSTINNLHASIFLGLIRTMYLPMPTILSLGCSFATHIHCTAASLLTIPSPVTGRLDSNTTECWISIGHGN